MLSILEILADKIREFGKRFGSVDSFIKSIVMFGTTLAVMDMQSVEIFQSMGYTMESVTVTFAAAFGAQPVELSGNTLAVLWDSPERDSVHHQCHPASAGYFDSPD